MADSNSKFKVGDRVRTKGYEGTHWDGEGVIVSVGGYCNIVKINDEEGGFHDHELAPATLQLEAGKYYRTRDGLKVGPMKLWWSEWTVEHPWEDGDTGDLYLDNGTSTFNESLIAEWVDEPKSTKEILDDLEAWMAEQDASRDNTPTPTAGFTVPLCAYEDAVTTTALGDAYVAGYKAGLAAQQAAAQQALTA